MRLQRSKSRTTESGKEYHKWVLNPPGVAIETLGWREGTELEAVAKDGALIIREAQTPAKGGGRKAKDKPK